MPTHGVKGRARRRGGRRSNHVKGNRDLLSKPLLPLHPLSSRTGTFNITVEFWVFDDGDPATRQKEATNVQFRDVRPFT